MEKKDKRKIRILVAKLGCDIHERGAWTLLHAFRDAGMEAVYTGRYQSPESVAKTAVAEAVDVIALSDHTGSMPVIAASVLEALKKIDATDIRIIAGGLILSQDLPELEKMGVSGNYGPGTPLNVITTHIKELFHK
jgi:methylmalonyl-CoA mutase C-terminal domain/subunit